MTTQPKINLVHLLSNPYDIEAVYRVEQGEIMPLPRANGGLYVIPDVATWVRIKWQATKGSQWDGLSISKGHLEQARALRKSAKPVDYAVKCSAACMPSSCWGSYQRIALLLVDPTVYTYGPISDRTKGVIEVLGVFEKCHVGQTSRSQADRMHLDATVRADILCAVAKVNERLRKAA